MLSFKKWRLGHRQLISLNSDLNEYWPQLILEAETIKLIHFWPSPCVSELYFHLILFLSQAKANGRENGVSGNFAHFVANDLKLIDKLPLETEPVACDNTTIWTLKPDYKTSAARYSTDNRSNGRLRTALDRNWSNKLLINLPNKRWPWVSLAQSESDILQCTSSKTLYEVEVITLSINHKIE